ncbi:FkbM family methyltransferase [Streptomyces violaceusniger]
MEHMTLPNGKPVAHVSAGETALLYRDIFLERCYMQHSIALEPGMVVFDVGSNVGLSVLFFDQECPGMTFYAFEPAPVPFAALKENIERHHIAARAMPYALSNASGEAEMTYYPEATVMSGLYADAAVEAALSRRYLLASGFSEADAQDLTEDKFETVSVPVETRTLSQMIDEFDIARIDLLKIDVEKSEFLVLEGLADDDWPKVRQVVAEVHDREQTLESFVALLESKDFTVFVEQDRLLSGSEIYEVFAIQRGVSR